MNKLTANGGIAPVIHKAVEKNNRKRVYTCESVKERSLTRYVNAKEITNEATK